MTEYAMTNSPNQSFTTTIGGHSVYVLLHTFRNVMYATVSIDDRQTDCGVKCTQNASILCRESIRTLGGDFVFRCETDDYPSSDTIGENSCSLLFVEM